MPWKSDCHAIAAYRSGRILLVNETERDRDHDLSLLRHAGYAVDPVEDLSRVWRAISRCRYDVLIVGCRTLERAGADFEWRLHYAGASVPVVITADGFPIGLVAPGAEHMTDAIRACLRCFGSASLLDTVKCLLDGSAAGSRRRHSASISS